jgi:outer membrane murein-binding lipoprotein Lpp
MSEMARVMNTAARVKLVAVIVLGGLSLAGCATKKYVNEQIADVNGRVSAADAKASDALQRADAANAAAQAAAGDARTANQRLDQLTARVDSMEQRPLRSPRN